MQYHIDHVHPLSKGGKTSIENLAYKLTSDGYSDNNNIYPIPKSEIGPFNGRLMWFPPYDIGFNESTSSKFISTFHPSCFNFSPDRL